MDLHSGRRETLSRRMRLERLQKALGREVPRLMLVLKSSYARH
jgi:hypothetical protein